MQTQLICHKGPRVHVTEDSNHEGESERRLIALTRPKAASIDAILGRAFPVLDDGFVRVVDYMGDDSSVVEAARVSYGAGTKRVQEDRALIRYLMRHAHTTPFEMCEIKLHVRAPMDTWRQWIRHRTASVNEYSTRYSIAIDSAQSTPADRWRLQSRQNKQGSGGYLEGATGSQLSRDEADFHQRARRLYEERIKLDVAREQARKDLPLSTYTEAYWKIDLHNLLNFLQLRMHEHAQEEIRTYASVIGTEIVSKWVPYVWEAFLDYKRHAISLSRADVLLIGAIAAGQREKALSLARELGMLDSGADGRLRASRERRELDEKLTALGLTFEWS
jgi:thymidylate synthase (FAD)